MFWPRSERMPCCADAASNGNVDVIRVLTQYKADMEARDQMQRTPLLIAAFKGYVRLSCFLRAIAHSFFKRNFPIILFCEKKRKIALNRIEAKASANLGAINHNKNAFFETQHEIRPEEGKEDTEFLKARIMTRNVVGTNQHENVYYCHKHAPKI
jgi:hypothetical protein